jgi:peptidoglycan/LPS O-acetylase OafA/YrhL
MLGAFNQNAYNAGIWSLVVEARISLVFPLILLLAMRWPWWLSLVSSWALGSILGLASGTGDVTSFAQTPAAVPLFVIGTVAAKHRSELAAFWNRLDPTRRLGLMLGAGVIYTLPGTIPFGWILRSHWLLDPAIGLSLLPVLAAALAGGHVTHALEMRPLHWLGERAYGVYLLHPPLLMLAAVVAGRSVWALSLAQCAAFLLLLLLAHLLYLLVELPSIRFGHRLSEHPLQQPEVKRAGDPR